MVPAPKRLSQRRGGAALPALWGFRAPELSRIFIKPWWEAWASTKCPSWILAPPAPGKGGSPDIDQAQRQEETGPGVPPQLPQAGQWVAGAAPSPTGHTPVCSGSAALATDSLGPNTIPLPSAPLSRRSQCPRHPISNCWLPCGAWVFSFFVCHR